MGEAVAEACRRSTRRWRSRARRRRSWPRLSTGNSVVGLTSPRLERGRGGHDLEGRARRLRRREGDPGQRADLAVARVERRDPAEAPGERGHGRLLEARVDRGAHRPGGAAAGRARARGVPARSSPPGRPGQPVLEGLLEAVLPDRPVAREAVARRAPRRSSAVSCGRERPGDRAGDRLERRAAVAGRAAREHLAVARQQRGALGRARCARESASPRRRPGKASSGPQVDPLVRRPGSQQSRASCGRTRACRPRSAPITGAAALAVGLAGLHARRRSPWPRRRGRPRRNCARAGRRAGTASSSRAYIARVVPRSQASVKSLRGALRRRGGARSDHHAPPRRDTAASAAERRQRAVGQPAAALGGEVDHGLKRRSPTGQGWAATLARP